MIERYVLEISGRSTIELKDVFGAVMYLYVVEKIYYRIERAI